MTAAFWNRERPSEEKEREGSRVSGCVDLRLRGQSSLLEAVETAQFVDMFRPW